MKKIGLISDTHNYLHPYIFQIFQDVDMILHAGDICEQEILENLRTIAPVIAVRGNMDYYGSTKVLPPLVTTKIEGLPVLITHDIGDIDKFHQKLISSSNFTPPQLILFGHTHRARYQIEDGVIYINPGSATSSRDSRKPSVMLIEIEDTEITKHDLIELPEN